MIKLMISKKNKQKIELFIVPDLLYYYQRKESIVMNI